MSPGGKAKRAGKPSARQARGRPEPPDTAARATREFARAPELPMRSGRAHREIASVTGLRKKHEGGAVTRARQRPAGLRNETTDELE